MKNKSLLLYIFFIGILTIACTNKTDNGNSESKLKALEEEIKIQEEEILELSEENDDFKISIKYLEEEIDNFIDFSHRAIAYLDEGEIKELSKNEWEYRIDVHETEIPLNGKLEISKGDFEITYSERNSSLASIEDKIYNYGKISGDYQDHLDIIGIEPDNIATTDGTVVTSFVYEFKDIQEGRQFQLEISNELKERLNLDTNIIDILVK